MRTILFSILLVLVAGCTKQTKPDLPVETPTPIVVTTKPAKPANVPVPHLPVDDLTKDSDTDEVAKAYVSTVKILKNYSRQLRAALQPFEDAYRNWQKENADGK